MNIRMHDNYRRVIEKAKQSHEQNRNPGEIGGEDVAIARLYCYAFRLHIIGVFNATRIALQEFPPPDPLSEALRLRAVEMLEDLANQSMEVVPTDFRVVITTLARYHRGILRALGSLEAEYHHTRNEHVRKIAGRFREIVEQITGECGIHLTQDTHAPEQASFVVPGLGIIIVPLIYGDHHSWNLAWLAGDARDVPTHRHQHGVEIHLGYNPAHGMTVLGDCRAAVDEGYAMPIPPETDHGWVNTSEEPHHVPFIFGSLPHAGWGVFLDVEPRIRPIEELKLVGRDSPTFNQMIYLEREIDQAARMRTVFRKTLIPFTVTNRQDSGGLELSLTRINPAGFSYDVDEFRAVSIARGQGIVSIEGVERSVSAHDHFGIPSGLTGTIRQTGDEPLVVLDATIKGFTTC